MKNKKKYSYTFLFLFSSLLFHAMGNSHICDNKLPSNKIDSSPAITLLGEPIIVINENNQVFVSFTLQNKSSNRVNLSSIAIVAKNVSTQQAVAFKTDAFIPDFAISSYRGYPIHNVKIFSSEKYEQLSIGAYTISLEYQIDDSAHVLPLSFFRKLGENQLDTYQIKVRNYRGLRIYALRGGMSAEYVVQKSLAALRGGVSHTWDVREKLNGQLDITGGGPVSVYSTRHFLKKSLEKTVQLYNAELGANTTFNTVFISTGVPAAPYFSYYMGAPILPLHFLVSVNSLSEVETMVQTGNVDGYSCYATAGYDPSIEAEGVAWIKLLDLPDEYKKFIEDHNVENVVLMGATESGWGEVIAQRIIFKRGVISNPSVPEQGSVYVMKHGGEEGLNNLKTYFKDYEDYSKEPERAIADWESGITKYQINNFKTAIKNISTSNTIDVYAIEGTESIGFYNITMDLAFKFWKKNEVTLGTNPVSGIAMNEYLIGYPAYESKVGQIPMLYWQSSPDNTAARVKNLLQYKTTTAYPSINFKALPVKFNAKFDRSPFVNAIREKVRMVNVTQNSWQKADIWDPSDGLDAPCELVAKDIINNQGGAKVFQKLVSSLTKLTIDDLKSMTVHEKATLPVHPRPSVTVGVAHIPEAGLDIKRYEFPAQAYWNSKEQLKEMGFYDCNAVSPTFLGWMDGFSKTGNERKQRITISQFDLGNTSDEYELKVGYKFSPKKEDGFTTYDPAKDDEQNMNCFEYTKVPKTSWLDIPSRVMAREGAVWIVNGSVYDWDYNGLPGVVPFIKKKGVVKAQPQILSYKGEGVFAWNWGTQKSVSILGRPKEISGNGLVNELKTLFHEETANYSNVLAGMTFMNGGDTYNVKGLQPQWMLDYPEFNPKYLGPSGTAIRCFLSSPDPTKCKVVLENAWGSFEDAPKEEGWNNCSYLSSDEYVKRFSSLAYRQYDKLFERVPNARSYVAIKGSKLDVGIIDGDLGNFADARGVNYAKSFGMKNSEVNEFYKYMGYEQLINLDGGSSSQIWYNGRGPLHDWTGYPLIADNQGPYYSRLVSSYLMLVPKKHTSQVSKYKSENTTYMQLDNSDMSFDYEDNSDHGADKAFISLSPSLDLLTNGNKGMIAGNFKIENAKAAKGAILYYQGEDTYYEDTGGLREVVPRMRNILLVGIGKIPKYILKVLKGKPTNGNVKVLRSLLDKNNHAMYFIKMHDSNIVQYFFEDDAPYTKYIDNTWHSFMIYRGIPTYVRDSVFPVPTFSVTMDNEEITGGRHTSTGTGYNMFSMEGITHAAIGMANIDGRFVTGNANMAVDNYLLIIGDNVSNFSSAQKLKIANSLTLDRNLPNFADKYYGSDTYALQFEEALGRHSFSLAEVASDVRLYGLNLNTVRVQSTLEDLALAFIKPGDYYMVDGADTDKCISRDSNGSLSWRTYKDEEGNTEWSLCDQVEVKDESIHGESYTVANRSIKVKTSYMALDPLHLQATTLPGRRIKVANHNLYTLPEKMILKPHKISATPHDTPTIALIDDDKRGSFSYKFVKIPTSKKPSTDDSGGFSYPVDHKTVLIGALTGGGVLVGAGSLLIYGLYRSIIGRQSARILQGTQTEIELPERRPLLSDETGGTSETDETGGTSETGETDATDATGETGGQSRPGLRHRNNVNMRGACNQ